MERQQYYSSCRRCKFTFLDHSVSNGPCPGCSMRMPALFPPVPPPPFPIRPPSSAVPPVRPPSSAAPVYTRSKVRNSSSSVPPPSSAVPHPSRSKARNSSAVPSQPHFERRRSSAVPSQPRVHRSQARHSLEEPGLIPEEEDDAIGVEHEETAETFTDYRPQKLSIGPPHPDPIVETSSLSGVQPPEPTYTLAIKNDLEDTKKLSCLQIESLVYASQRHLHHLPSGERAGFFIGDGAGVGKGRTVAGLIWENWCHGRRKSIWISVGSDLKFDARRDLDDMGANCIEVHALNKLPYSSIDSAGIHEGVIFSTYTSLISGSGNGGTRLQQLVQWCGPDFDGLIIFDECHKAKNLVPGGSARQKKPTRTGLAVVEIQALLPQARTVYCSATGASEPRNMAYMVRLGLWGDGTCFPEFDDFLAATEQGGVGALELVAMDMKARGMYVCRTLSHQGSEFEVVEVPLEAKTTELYAKASEFWVDLRKDLLTREDIDDKRQLWTMYWGTHQRFFRHILMSAKVAAVVKIAKQALMEDKCVVIGLQSTGEAQTEGAVAKYGTELDDFVSGPRELLLKFVKDYCIGASEWMKRKRDSDASGGRARKVAKHSMEGIIDVDDSDVSSYLEKVEQMDLPNNPLDDIIDQLGGPENVAEITGRRGMLVRGATGRGVTYQSRGTTDVAMEMVNMHEKQLFMNGEKLVAIISEAGSAGVSLQADKRAVNQKRRVHLTIELPWSADRAIQQFGRTHRSNQASAPQYKMLFTDVGGERRFASIVAKRLETLGALIQGDRRAGARKPSLSAYNYDSNYGKAALDRMYDGILGRYPLPVVPPGCSVSDFKMQAEVALTSVGIVTDSDSDCGGTIKEADKRNVARFLNRLLGLAPGMQNRLFELFVAIFDHLIENARAEGNLETCIVDLRAQGVELKEKPKTVYIDAISGASTQLYTFTCDRGVKFESALAMLQERRGDGYGFYKAKKEWMGRRQFLLALDGKKAGSLRIFRPGVGDTRKEMPVAELNDKYDKISSLEIARAGWEEEYHVLYKQCLHGPNCDARKRGKVCTYGGRLWKVNVLAGIVLPIWSTVGNALNKKSLPKKQRIKVVRIETTSGMSQRVIGLLLPNAAAVETLLHDLNWIQDIDD